MSSNTMMRLMGKLNDVSRQNNPTIFNLHLDNISSETGSTLNLEEKMKLSVAFQQLVSHQDYEDQQLFGKVTGTDQDYFVVIAWKYTGEWEFPSKKYFWCTSNNFQFAELPLVDPSYRDEVDTMNTLFTGKFDKELIGAENKKEGEDEKKEEVNENDEVKSETSVEVIPPRKAFTELDRLSYVVRAIDHDCSAVPRGAQRITPTHELRQNNFFSGLSQDQSLDIDYWHHFRAVEQKEKREILDRDEGLQHDDFLDQLNNDLPKGQWSIHKSWNNRAVTVRSLLWPGYVAQHTIGTNQYGSVYLGSGTKNSDLPFLI